MCNAFFSFCCMTVCDLCLWQSMGFEMLLFLFHFFINTSKHRQTTMMANGKKEISHKIRKKHKTRREKNKQKCETMLLKHFTTHYFNLCNEKIKENIIFCLHVYRYRQRATKSNIVCFVAISFINRETHVCCFYYCSVFIFLSFLFILFSHLIQTSMYLCHADHVKFRCAWLSGAKNLFICTF